MKHHNSCICLMIPSQLKQTPAEWKSIGSESLLSSNTTSSLELNTGFIQGNAPIIISSQGRSQSTSILVVSFLSPCPRPVTNCSRVKIMSLLIYQILNYDRFDKTNMTIDQSSILDDQSSKITTMAASVLQLCHKTAQMSQQDYNS